MHSLGYRATFIPFTPYTRLRVSTVHESHRCPQNAWAQMATNAGSKVRPVIFVTNDDGISPKSALILPLARHLTAHGHDVVVCAPGENNSACGQRITISTSLTLRRHPKFESQFRAEAGVDGNEPGSLSVFSIDEGTPSDCVISGVEPKTGLLAKLGLRPAMVLSGINVGRNLGNDVLYSGTFAAARQAAMYGIPGIAISLDFHSRQPNAEKHRKTVRNGLIAAERIVAAALSILPSELPDSFRTSESVENGNGNKSNGVRFPMYDEAAHAQSRLIQAFAHGHVTLNVNVPTPEWDGTFTACTLDRVLYYSAADIDKVPSGQPGDRGETFTFKLSGLRVHNLMGDGSDVALVQRSKSASVTPVSTWPMPHISALSEQFFTQVTSTPSPFWDNAMNVEDAKNLNRL